MRWRAELKVRGYYTQELEELQDALQSSDDQERETRGQEYVRALAQAYREMPRWALWHRVTGL